jgi:hypothetical protein
MRWRWARNKAKNVKSRLGVSQTSDKCDITVEQTPLLVLDGAVREDAWVPRGGTHVHCLG